MRWSAEVQVQAVGGTCGGTAESARGSEVKIGDSDYMTLFIDYVAGDEGTLYLYPKFRHASAGSAYQWQDWSSAAGDKTLTTNRLKLTASVSDYVVFDVRGMEYVQFYSITGAAATGTLGLFLTLSGT